MCRLHMRCHVVLPHTYIDAIALRARNHHVAARISLGVFGGWLVALRQLTQWAAGIHLVMSLGGGLQPG